MNDEPLEIEEEAVPETFSIDLDSLPKQEHNWIDRGLKMTCESPSHPYHEAWKRRTI